MHWKIFSCLCVVFWASLTVEQLILESNKTAIPPDVVIINKANVTNVANSKNVTVAMERITQPAVISNKEDKFQTVGRTLVVVDKNTSKDLMDFRPSPQVNTYYEYNRFPVAPAYPEAKHFSVLNVNEKPVQSEVIPWERPPSIYASTTQSPWYNRINFPTTQPSFTAVHEQPYPYLVTRNQETTPHPQYSYVITPKVHYSYEATSPQSVSTQSDALGIIEKLGGSLFGGKGGLDTQNHNFGSTSSPNTTMSPWQKVIKFLTAVIPIGLLLSALTPTIINVSPMNMTQKGRSLDDQEYTTKHLISSLNYINTLNKKGCEERALCELLISSGSRDIAEKHAQNLFNVFNDYDQHVFGGVKELNNILYALKNANCSFIPCDNIDDIDHVELKKEP